MKCKLIWPLCVTLLICFCFAQCKKHRERAKTELEKLPPITQTGANTFGCLLNRVAWIPKDNYGQATFELQADPTFGFGSFGVTAERHGDNTDFFGFSFGSDSLVTTGFYPFSNKRNAVSIVVSNATASCAYASYQADVFISGGFTVTRYDLTNRIFSGTFDFKIYKSGCGDTLHFTNGRFDKRL